jgi:tyrosyl-tRNA synthetase
MNKFLKEFKDRGFFYQCINEEELSNLLNNEKIKGYIGFDCTAESLHVGSLLQIMCLRLLQKHGHRPIVLLGGGTTRIGDPSGKDKTRTILGEKEIEKNIKNIEKILKNFLDIKDPKIKPIFVNNYSWLKNLNYISFLREIGKHFTINKMLSFDSVKTRLEREQSLSYMEFNYMILQAFDFLELSKKKDCSLQIGGSDQWGNIVNGVELIKRYSNKQVYGLTTPLITLASGAKMGKTEKGAIWLDKKFLSSYDYWQFWRNTDDRDVIKFLKFFTDLELEEIDKIKSNDINQLKILLANETTSMLHGEKAAIQSEKAAKEAFSGTSIGSNLPTVKISKKNFNNKINIIELVILSKLENSKSEIRRLIKGNAIKINNIIIDNEKVIITNEMFEKNYLKLSIGKKKTYKNRIRLVFFNFF